MPFGPLGLPVSQESTLGPICSWPGSPWRQGCGFKGHWLVSRTQARLRLPLEVKARAGGHWSAGQTQTELGGRGQERLGQWRPGSGSPPENLEASGCGGGPGPATAGISSQNRAIAGITGGGGRILGSRLGWSAVPEGGTPLGGLGPHAVGRARPLSGPQFPHLSRGRTITVPPARVAQKGTPGKRQCPHAAGVPGGLPVAAKGAGGGKRKGFLPPRAPQAGPEAAADFGEQSGSRGSQRGTPPARGRLADTVIAS